MDFWRIPWTEEPGGLQSMGSQRVRYDFACVYWTVTSSNFKGKLEKEMATHSSVLAWRIPGTGEPGGLPSVGSYRVGHDWSDLVVVVVITVVSNSLTPRTAALQASLSFPISQSLFKLTSIELVMPSNHQILCDYCLLLPSIFPSIRVFSNESVLCIRWPKFGVSSSTSVIPMNTQVWSPIGWTGWIFLQSKGLSRVFSNTAVQKHQLFSTQLSL